jgi:hypothetical protein
MKLEKLEFVAETLIIKTLGQIWVGQVKVMNIITP